MVLPRQQAQFGRAGWRLRYLAPTWLLQLLIPLTLVGLFSWRLSETVANYDEEERQGLFPIVEVVWESTNIGLSLICLACAIYELHRLLAETLTPWTMLFTHVIKVTCSFAMLGLDILVLVQRKDGHYSLVGLILDVVLIASIVVPAIYSIQTYRRLAAFDDYHCAVDPKASGYDDLERDTSYNRRSSAGSGGGSRRRDSPPSPWTPGGQEDATSLEMIRRTPSQYNNEQDTAFDKNRVEHAINAEFGWVVSPTGALERSGSVVGSGVVASAKPRPTEGATRSSSWGSSKVLFDVPEADEVDGDLGMVSLDGTGDGDMLLASHRRSQSHDSVTMVPRIEIEEVGGPDPGHPKRTWTG